MTLSRASVLHYWSARYGPLPIIGGDPTHTRNSIASWIDGQGILQSAVVNTPGLEHAVISNERRAVMPLARAVTNIVLQAEDHGVTWAVSGTPTRVAAAHIISGITLDLIGDDSGASVEYYSQNLNFTGNAGKAISFHVKKGTSAPANGSDVVLADVTAGQNRLSGILTWTASGLPSMSMSAGTFVGYKELIDGVFRLFFRTTSVTAANTNNLSVRPAQSSAEQGNIYLGGYQAENAGEVGPYVKTTTASVTKSADTFYWDYTPLPQQLAMYVRFIERGLLADSARVIQIGGSTGPKFLLMGDAAGSRYRCHHNNNVSVVDAYSTGAGAFGDTVELIGILNPDGAVTIIASINGAAVTSQGSSALTIGAAWSATRLYAGADGGVVESMVDLAETKIVKLADCVGFDAQTRMDELRAFELNAEGEVISDA